MNVFAYYFFCVPIHAQYSVADGYIEMPILLRKSPLKNN